MLGLLCSPLYLGIPGILLLGSPYMPGPCQTYHSEPKLWDLKPGSCLWFTGSMSPGWCPSCSFWPTSCSWPTGPGTSPNPVWHSLLAHLPAHLSQPLAPTLLLFASISDATFLGSPRCSALWTSPHIVRHGLVQTSVLSQSRSLVSNNLLASSSPSNCLMTACSDPWERSSYMLSYARIGTKIVENKFLNWMMTDFM